jgi:CubicO group peptidase (beta-lactamase class C family)
MRFVTLAGAMALLMLGGVALGRRTASAAPPTRLTASAPAPHRLDRADVDTWLDGFMPYALANGDIAGVVVVVVKDGQVLTQRGYGFADVDARKLVNPATTLFRPGSVAKLITWTAVMQQVEVGRIDLDADVNRYLDFAIPPFDGKPVTMRQIMTHTAGFEERNKGLIFTDHAQLRSIGDYVKSWIPRRIYAPGTTPAYSNYATALAGYIVQRVSGMPFDAYVEQRIFAPLGMRHSSFRQPLPAALSAMMSRGYMRGSAAAASYELVGPAPAGSLASSAVDMARFMIAHLQDGELEGRRILQPATARMMHDTSTVLMPPLNGIELGFLNTSVNDRRVIGHLGDTRLFHTALHLFLDEKVGLYLSLNSSGRDGAAGAIRYALLTGFADRYFPHVSRDRRLPATIAAEHARMMRGNWRSSRRTDSGFARALRLGSPVRVDANARGELVIPDLKGPGGQVHRWVEIAPFVWREVGGRDRIAAKVANGRVIRWSADSFSPFMVFDRVPAIRDASWILPLLYVSVAILLLSVLLWPIAALVRRRYGAPPTLKGYALFVDRSMRGAAAVTLAVLAIWFIVVPPLLGDVSTATSHTDRLLWALQSVGALAFGAMAGLAVANLWLTLRHGRGWAARGWAVLCAAAALAILCGALGFGLLDMTVNY